MDRRDQDYDEDVFSLEEDLAREHRKQWTQYLVVAICAVAVIALAFYGSIVLTKNRLANEENIKKTQIETQPDATALPGATVEPVEVNFWPSEYFPEIPVLDSAAYETEADAGYAQIKVPSATARNFDAYITELTEQGAAVYARTSRLSVLVLDGVEIHLITSNQGNRVVLCKEPAYGWSDTTYAAFPIPEKGRLISVKEAGLTRELTYRGATTLDALTYAASLVEQGWALSGSLEPTNNIFLGAYQKNNLQITVDYFSTGDNYVVKLEFQN